MSPRSPRLVSSPTLSPTPARTSTRPLPNVAKGLAKEQSVIAAHPEWLIEESTDIVQNPELTEIRNIYSAEFGSNTPHINFIVTKGDEGIAIFVCFY